MSEDSTDDARQVIVPCRKLSSKIQTLDDAEIILQKVYGPKAEIITFGPYEEEMNASSVLLEIDGNLITI